MADLLLSEAERTFILHGVQDNLRVDGRGCEDFRSIEIETDVVSNSSGSARIRLSHTDVLVGVKAELGEPLPDRPNEGRMEFFVDCSANATPKFEGRGGEDLAIQISNMLARMYDNQQCLDLRSLCVTPRLQCWVLYVDVLILECGGNLFDAASVGVKCALFNAKIPSVRVTSGETGHRELELSDDPYDCMRIDTSEAPCIVTLNKIGMNHIVDATMQEEACSVARLLIGVTERGTITALNKEGTGSLDPESIYDMIECGRRVGMALNKSVRLKLDEDENITSKDERAGFLR